MKAVSTENVLNRQRYNNAHVNFIPGFVAENILEARGEYIDYCLKHSPRVHHHDKKFAKNLLGVKNFRLSESSLEMFLTIDAAANSTSNKFHPYRITQLKTFQYCGKSKRKFEECFEKLNERQKLSLCRTIGIPVINHVFSSSRVPGSVHTENSHIYGYLFYILCNAKDKEGYRYKEIYEPFSGSAFNSNISRMMGFSGKIILNDINPLITNAEECKLHSPEKVQEEYENLIEDMVKFVSEILSKRLEGQEFEFDRFGRHRFKSERQASEFKEKNGDLLKEIRQLLLSHVKNNVFKSLNIRGNEKSHLEYSKATKYRIAAFYLLFQDNVHLGRDVIHFKEKDNEEPFPHFPVSWMIVGQQRLMILTRVNNKNKISFLSNLHNEHPGKTEIKCQDGWTLIDEIKNHKSLVFLSGHFSDKYHTKNEFLDKIQSHVVPYINNGGSVIMINSLNNKLEAELKRLKFATYKAEGVGNGKKDYLLAVSPEVVEIFHEEMVKDKNNEDRFPHLRTHISLASGGTDDNLSSQIPVVNYKPPQSESIRHETSEALKSKDHAKYVDLMRGEENTYILKNEQPSLPAYASHAVACNETLSQPSIDSEVSVNTNEHASLSGAGSNPNLRRDSVIKFANSNREMPRGAEYNRAKKRSIHQANFPHVVTGVTEPHNKRPSCSTSEVTRIGYGGNVEAPCPHHSVNTRLVSETSFANAYQIMIRKQTYDLQNNNDC